MYKQVSIFLFGILFFVVAIQCARLPYNNNGELNLKYQRLRKTHESVKDHLFLKRNKRDFNDQQRQFQQEMLQAHNQYRSHHCVSPLQLDDNLSSSAQQYAEHLVDIDTLQHSGTPGVGENLYMIVSSGPITDINGYQPTDGWYNEVYQYDFAHGDFSPNTGHFTQLVWKSTERLGAGIAYNSDRTKVYIAAQYSPPGNYLGQFQENVFPSNC